MTIEQRILAERDEILRLARKYGVVAVDGKANPEHRRLYYECRECRAWAYTHNVAHAQHCGLGEPLEGREAARSAGGGVTARCECYPRADSQTLQLNPLCPKHGTPAPAATTPALSSTPVHIEATFSETPGPQPVSEPARAADADDNLRFEPQHVMRRLNRWQDDETVSPLNVRIILQNAEECIRRLVGRGAPAAVEIQGVEVTRRTLRRIVDAAWNEATESETVPDTWWADRIINRVLTEPAKQPGIDDLRDGEAAALNLAFSTVVSPAPADASQGKALCPCAAGTCNKESVPPDMHEHLPFRCRHEATPAAPPVQVEGMPSRETLRRQIVADPDIDNDAAAAPESGLAADPEDVRGIVGEDVWRAVERWGDTGRRGTILMHVVKRIQSTRAPSSAQGVLDGEVSDLISRLRALNPSEENSAIAQEAAAMIDSLMLGNGELRQALGRPSHGVDDALVAAFRERWERAMTITTDISRDLEMRNVGREMLAALNRSAQGVTTVGDALSESDRELFEEALRALHPLIGRVNSANKTAEKIATRLQSTGGAK